MTLHTLHYGTTTINYRLSYAERQTLGIAVNPDCTVEVVAPQGCPLSQVERYLKRRRKWIVTQQQELERFLPLLPPRQYVSGETHLYLGKQYRLKVLEGHTPAMTLMRGRFTLITRNKEDKEAIKAQLDEWYRQKAEQIFAELLTESMKRAIIIGIHQPPPLKIRLMQKRWGSCTAQGTIILNLKLIQVSKPLIEYVIMHELCHLKEHNHRSAYYTLLDRIMPNWRERKEALNQVKVA